jgi:hypothetical protein
MKLLGQQYALEALELAAASGRRRAVAAAPPDDDLSPRPSREESAAAWRRWAARGDTRTATDLPADGQPGRRGRSSVPVPRTGI